MKKIACSFTLIGCLALASCNSSTEDHNTKVVEEKEDKAAEAADNMQEVADEQDTTAVKVEH